MGRLDETTKHQRLEAVWALVRRHPRGILEREIAEMLNWPRRTINNYLRQLEAEGRICKDGRYWRPLPWEETRLRPIELTPEEAVALYLGARLLSKQMDRRNEPAESALIKLANALRNDAGLDDEIVQAARVLTHRPEDPRRRSLFQTVVRGYIYRRKVRLLYKPLNWKRPFETTFAIYLLEPSLIGSAIYLIGHSSRPDALRAYKLDRIQEATLTAEAYDIPADFAGLDYFRHAWNIMAGEEPLEVVLRFSPRVRERVAETIWHPSQQVTEDPEREGWLRWQAHIAHLQDILPWIRSWGADVEVLAPEELRKALEREVRRLAAVYRVSLAQADTPRYYAHSRPDVPESEWQLLKEHLYNTAELAAQMGDPLGIAELARAAALLHDLGKYSDAFQARLRGAPLLVDHATAGAREIVRLFADTPQRLLAELLSFAIAGHHTGLPDYGSPGDIGEEGTLLARREKKELEDYSAYKREIDLSTIQLPNLKLHPARFRLHEEEKTFWGFSMAFLTRMLFSVLVDADWLETERFMKDEAKPRGQHASIEALAQQFNQYLQRFENPTTPINRKRTETLHACIRKATKPPGFFKLTVPTGGGKTYASMAFALNHAVHHGLRRVIYVIPFTSIIEQNADKFREALGPLGAENVLEHHSSFDWERNAEDDETDSVLQKLKLAAENWDVPIVVTTNVQFFESLFANKKRAARKLHNIARSVIIFDEVQTLPREYLQPTLLAVQELVQNYGCTAVFCTATQPALEQFFPRDIQFTELAPNPPELYAFYRRVKIRNLGELTDEELLERLNSHNQVLCIVNTRRHARGLFEGLRGEGNFHLSTLMCPAHRRKVLAEIRERLAKGQPCRVVSTQVLEAGIDVDFPVGYRALAGLDSIIQAAGRVNREMKRPHGEVFVFTPKTPLIKRTPAFIQQTGAVAQAIFRKHTDNPDSLEAVADYYRMLYTLQGGESFDTYQILHHLEARGGRPAFEFQQVAEKFKLIRENTVSIFIPYDEDARRLLAQLPHVHHPVRLLRKLQPYTVNIYEREFERLQAQGVIWTIGETYYVLDEDAMPELYSPDTGLRLVEDEGGAGIFVDR